MKVIELERVSLSHIENLKLFVNTLTADYKYSLLNRRNLKQSIQMRSSQKQKGFFSLVLCIFQIYIKFSTFSNKDDPHRLCISEITDSERCG